MRGFPARCCWNFVQPITPIQIHTRESAFVDPSVRFGLQFDRKDNAAGEKPEAAAVAPTPLPAPEKRPAQAGPTGDEDKPADAAAEAKPEDAASKIVKLDSFRKK